MKSVQLFTQNEPIFLLETDACRHSLRPHEHRYGFLRFPPLSYRAHRPCTDDSHKLSILKTSLLWKRYTRPLKEHKPLKKTTRLLLKSLQIPREISHLVKKNHVFYAKKSTPLLEATTSLSLTPTQNKRVINIRHNKEITCQCKNNLSFRTQVREYTFWIYAHGTIQVVPSERFFHMCAKSVLHHFHIYHCIQNCR